MTPDNLALLARAEFAPWHNPVPDALLLDLLNAKEFDALRVHVETMETIEQKYSPIDL